MTTVNIYLTFNGNCREAFNFYKSVFGGEFPYIGTYGEMPSHEGAPPVPEEMKNQIMHISLPISTETVIMGSDCGGDWAPQFKQGNNFSISVNVDSRDDADRIFNSLGAGGTIVMPLAEMFWQEYFGMLTDKFGINWMMSYALPAHK